MKNRLVESKDRKQKHHMQKLFLKNKMRNKMIENQNRFTMETAKEIVPDEGEHLLQYRQKDFKYSVSRQNKA